jgi:hypothetical protein
MVELGVGFNHGNDATFDEQAGHLFLRLHFLSRALFEEKKLC